MEKGGAQRNEVYQALKTDNIFLDGFIVAFVFVFFMRFMDNKKNIEPLTDFTVLLLPSSAILCRGLTTNAQQIELCIDCNVEKKCIIRYQRGIHNTSVTTDC